MKPYNLSFSTQNSPQAYLPTAHTQHLSLRIHNSPQARNPLIADVCYKAGYIDSWGRGVEKIADACKEAGLPAPHIFERSCGMVVELKKQLGELVEPPVKTSGKRRESVGKASGKILSACQENSSITIPEMAKLCDITERSVQRNIQKLQADGLLRRVGGRKEGYWEVISSGSDE